MGHPYEAVGHNQVFRLSIGRGRQSKDNNLTAVGQVQIKGRKSYLPDFRSNEIERKTSGIERFGAGRMIHSLKNFAKAIK